MEAVVGGLNSAASPVCLSGLVFRKVCSFLPDPDIRVISQLSRAHLTDRNAASQVLVRYIDEIRLVLDDRYVEQNNRLLELIKNKKLLSPFRVLLQADVRGLRSSLVEILSTVDLETLRTLGRIKAPWYFDDFIVLLVDFISVYESFSQEERDGFIHESVHQYMSAKKFDLAVAAASKHSNNPSGCYVEIYKTLTDLEEATRARRIYPKIVEPDSKALVDAFRHEVAQIKFYTPNDAIDSFVELGLHRRALKLAFESKFDQHLYLLYFKKKDLVRACKVGRMIYKINKEQIKTFWDWMRDTVNELARAGEMVKSEVLLALEQLEDDFHKLKFISAVVDISIAIDKIQVLIGKDKDEACSSILQDCVWSRNYTLAVRLINLTNIDPYEPLVRSCISSLNEGRVSNLELTGMLNKLPDSLGKIKLFCCLFGVRAAYKCTLEIEDENEDIKSLALDYICEDQLKVVNEEVLPEEKKGCLDDALRVVINIPVQSYREESLIKVLDTILYSGLLVDIRGYLKAHHRMETGSQVEHCSIIWGKALEGEAEDIQVVDLIDEVTKLLLDTPSKTKLHYKVFTKYSNKKRLDKAAEIAASMPLSKERYRAFVGLNNKEEAYSIFLDLDRTRKIDVFDYTFLPLLISLFYKADTMEDIGIGIELSKKFRSSVGSFDQLKKGIGMLFKHSTTEAIQEMEAIENEKERLLLYIEYKVNTKIRELVDQIDDPQLKLKVYIALEEKGTALTLYKKSRDYQTTCWRHRDAFDLLFKDIVDLYIHSNSVSEIRMGIKLAKRCSLTMGRDVVRNRINMLLNKGLNEEAVLAIEAVWRMETRMSLYLDHGMYNEALESVLCELNKTTEFTLPDTKKQLVKVFEGAKLEVELRDHFVKSVMDYERTRPRVPSPRVPSPEKCCIVM